MQLPKNNVRLAGLIATAALALTPVAADAPAVQRRGGGGGGGLRHPRLEGSS